ncbi:FkbM family methyltransferase [Gemmatimonadota bacterium]
MTVRAAKSAVGHLLPRSFRNWIKAPAVSTRWAVDELRHRLGRDLTVPMRPGWTVRCHPAAYRVAYAILSEDPDQRAELNGFIGACTPGMLLFDIGAHFGVFSLAALHYGGENARAVAVDPSPMSMRMLATQRRINGVATRLETIHAAVTDEPGFAEFVSVGVLAAGYFTAPEKHHSKRERTTVRTVSVDQLVEQTGKRPTHLKIDVEGFEAGVLRGAQKLLAERPAPIVFLELHNEIIRSRGLDPAESLELLEQAGFCSFSLNDTPTTREKILSQPLIRFVARTPDDQQPSGFQAP